MTNDVSALQSPAIVRGLELADTDTEEGRVVTFTTIGPFPAPPFNYTIVAPGIVQAVLEHRGARDLAEGGLRWEPAAASPGSLSQLNINLCSVRWLLLGKEVEEEFH